MENLKEIYFENEFGKYLIIQIQSFYTKEMKVGLFYSKRNETRRIFKITTIC